MFDVLFEGDALWFSIPALLGTGVFVIRMILMLLGGDSGDGGAEFGDFGDAGDMGDVEFEGHDSAGAFEILSVQGISIFLMGFGWVGLACLLGTGWSQGTAIGLGALGGFLMFWIMAKTLGAVRGLESSGNVSIRSALGLEGDVYARVPARGDGRGQVRLVIDNRQRIFNAISGGDAVETSGRVRVVNVNDDHTLTVEAV